MTLRLLVTLALLWTPMAAHSQDRDQQRRTASKQAEIRGMAQETLEWLRVEKPRVVGQIEASSGFAVFDNLGFNARLSRTAYGYGAARNTRSGQVTYMKVRLLGGGLGMGVAGSRLLLIFKDRDRFDLFTREGMDVGLDIDLSSGATPKRAPDEVQPDDAVVYQITSHGLAKEASISGTKFWKDDRLN